jgi:hypothetical protein
MRSYTIFQQFGAAIGRAQDVATIENRETYVFRGDPKLGDYYIFSRAEHVPEPGAALMLAVRPEQL